MSVKEIVCYDPTVIGYSDSFRERGSAGDFGNFKPGHHESLFAEKDISDELLQMSYLDIPTDSVLLGKTPNGN